MSFQFRKVQSPPNPILFCSNLYSNTSFLFQKLAPFGVVDWKGVIYQNSAFSRSPDGCNVVLASPGNQICEISESSIPRD
uniref:Uncharacterized protein n=1 Tax=Salix viminalis TaxID=40686 RepID=A0A6N2MTS2_SALVM